METLDLDKAAEFLQMNPEVLRRKAKAGYVPGRKAGKRWVFIQEHLADWVSGRYPEPRRQLQVIDGGKTTEEKQPCRSTKGGKRGGFNSPTLKDDEYSNLLELK